MNLENMYIYIWLTEYRFTCVYMFNMKNQLFLAQKTNMPYIFHHLFQKIYQEKNKDINISVNNLSFAGRRLLFYSRYALLMRASITFKIIGTCPVLADLFYQLWHIWF